jgi:putative acetyltransferase
MAYAIEGALMDADWHALPFEFKNGSGAVCQQSRMNISPARSEEEIAAIRKLFEEYAGSLSVDLSYQGFPKELAELPGAYALPRGRLLLASDDDVPAGCVALRPVDNQTCEMKRLFVRPERQGLGVGRMLAERAITEARSIGYSTMLLDTLPNMHGALRLYESLGFVRRTPYFQTPVEGNVFMELRLGDDGGGDRRLRRR